MGGGGSKMSVEQRAHYLSIFMALDRDANANISREELTQMNAQADAEHRLSDEDLKTVVGAFEQMDADHNGQIDFDEFCNYIEGHSAWTNKVVQAHSHNPVDKTHATVNDLVSQIRHEVINDKANACPMVMRVAWHCSGTYDAKDNSGGSNGGTMRFKPEYTDGANAGLNIVRDMLHMVKVKNPDVSEADLWTLAGAATIEFMGGPKIPFKLGRTDAADESACPPNGRLPDAMQGAQHLRDVFHRMGFNDQEIVALSGGHTVGRAHIVRSGFDGPWTHNPLTFDNEYYRNLLNCTWEEIKLGERRQFKDKETGELMMLPTDMCLLDDPSFRPWVETYAADQDAFFRDFAAAYSKLLSNGCPAVCQPTADDSDSKKFATTCPRARDTSGQSADTVEFLERCMHGSISFVQRLAATADVHAVEKVSLRSGLHKASFWGHLHVVQYLVTDLKLNVNLQDNVGDTALHDSARFGHDEISSFLMANGADPTIQNMAGKTPAHIAVQYNKTFPLKPGSENEPL
jgi:uncharacterized cupin superfamily protein